MHIHTSSEKSSKFALTERDRILRHFPGDLVPSLIEFNKCIGGIDADIIIMMARKALRLHDLLILAGGKESRRIVLSHFILEQSAEHFRGKRVALIDDTLILGSTLARAVQTLSEAGAKEIKTYIFCADQDNWCRDLIQPTRVFATIPEDQVLTFCSAEVSAFGHSAIPYLSDFPITERIRLTRFSVDGLHGLTGWETFNLSTPSQEDAGIAYYTLLPTQELLAEIKQTLGARLFDVLDIVKIRVFARHVRTNTWARLVPIATLRPLSEQNVLILLSTVAECLNATEQVLLATLVTPASQLRWIQYAISLIVGRICLNSLTPLLNSRNGVRFDLHEATRIFGPWLTREIQRLHRTVDSRIPTLDGPLFSVGTDFREADLPPDLVKTVTNEYRMCVGGPDGGRNAGENRSIFTDLARAFVELHNRYELPARREAKALGARVLSVSAKEAPHRDRLRYGFAWRVLAEELVKGKRPLNRQDLARLSLLLDHLIDLGIAVPVLCHRDGLLFRAYRHGEDVLFGDQELALAHDAISGFIEGSQRDFVPALILEKVITSLIRVGSAKEFLTVLYGQSGREGVARIAFHLHGAVPILPTSATIFANDRESWLSKYMVDRQVLKTTSKGYELGNRPHAALRKRDANEEARQLGFLMGLLNRRDEKGTAAVLDEGAMIMLATCVLPRDVAAALAAELQIFCEWFDRKWCQVFATLDWQQISKLEEANQKLISGFGYMALNSGKFKASGYADSGPIKIVQAGEDALGKLPSGIILKSLWRGVWNPVLAGNTDEQREAFQTWIDRCAKEILIAQMNIFALELALTSGVCHLAPRKISRFNRACEKIIPFVNELSAKMTLSPREEKLRERLLSIANNRNPVTDSPRVAEFAMKGISDSLATTRALCRQVEDVVHDFGRMAGRTNYSHVLWYDIVDSTGQKSGLVGEALKTYRNRVRAFKLEIVNDLIGLSRDAARRDATIYGWKNTIGSHDDEKHLFITGTRSLIWLRETVVALFRRAKTHRLRLRMLAIPANFAGIPAYRYGNEPNVDGEAFWEHLSRLQMQLKSMEAEIESVSSYFWLAENLSTLLELRSLVSISKPIGLDVVTVIEDMELQTKVFGGPTTELA